MYRNLWCATAAIVWLCNQSLHAGSIAGTVYEDTNLNGSYNVGEEVSGILVQLFEDDGDRVFGIGDQQFGSDLTTGSDGIYTFANLDPTKSYYVVQPEQNVGSYTYTTNVEPLSVPEGPVLLIDDFRESQSDVVTPLDLFSSSIATSADILGGERDAFLHFLMGTADSKLRSNPYGLSDVLEFDQSAGVGSVAILTWDGIDGVADASAGTGLGGLDLTNGGFNTGIELTLGIDAAGASDTFSLRLYEGSTTNFSEVVMPIPVTDGTATATVVVPFSSFNGPVTAADVDAIQLTLGGQSPSIDMQIDFLGVIGPHVHNVSLTRSVPEPGTVRLMLIWAGLGLLGFRRDSRSPQSVK